MTLQEFAQFGGAISGVGIITSFVYFAVQIHSNTKALRAQTFQQLINSLSIQLDDLARNRELCTLLLRGGDDFEALDRVDKARFRFHLMSFMRRMENAYIQHRIGTLKDENWLGLRETMNAMFSSPGQRAAWSLIRGRFNPPFRVFIDGFVARAAALAAAEPTFPPVPDIKRSKITQRSQHY